MASNPLLYQLLLISLVLICLLVHVALPEDPLRVPKTPLEPKTRQRRRSEEPRPFAGLIHQPLCEACEQGADTRPRHQDYHRLSSPSRADAGAASIRKLTSVPIPIVRTTAGLDGQPASQWPPLVVSPGASSNVSLVAGTSMKPLARSFMASMLHLTPSYGLSRVCRMAAMGRRSATPCKREEGLRQQLALFQT